MYEIELNKAALKDLKKMDKPFRKGLWEKIEECAENPYAVEELKYDLAGFYSAHLTINGVEYRIVYEIFEGERKIVVYIAATRENFYSLLRRRLGM